MDGDQPRVPQLAYVIRLVSNPRSALESNKLPGSATPMSNSTFWMRGPESFKLNLKERRARCSF